MKVNSEIFFGTENKPHISKLMQHLTEDTERNNAIIKDVSLYSKWSDPVNFN